MAYRDDERYGLMAAPLHFHGPAMLRGIAAADALAVVPPGGAQRGNELELLELPWPAGWSAGWTPGRCADGLERLGGALGSLRPEAAGGSVRAAGPAGQPLGTACRMVITRSVSSRVAACGSV